MDRKQLLLTLSRNDITQYNQLRASSCSDFILILNNFAKDLKRDNDRVNQAKANIQHRKSTRLRKK